MAMEQGAENSVRAKFKNITRPADFERRKMRETILTCDRCKEKVKELIEVGAGKRSVYSGSSYSREHFELYQLVAEWCIDCCIKMHIASPCKESEAKPIQPPPTLEDMIREIIREEVENK